MKHLKSTLTDMHQVFDRSITVRYLAEPLVSFDVQLKASDVRPIMEESDFDVVGVRRRGKVVGYAKGIDLIEGELGSHVKPIDERFILEDTDSISTALQRLKESEQIFVAVLGEVAGIVTKGDLQKAPIRMWLFGLISLLEMQLLRIIREEYPNDTWKACLKEGRINTAQALLDIRKKANLNLDLADCLQFTDKKTIVEKSALIRQRLNFSSNTKAHNSLELNNLRDDLAHGQDIVTGRWPKLVELAEEAERLLAACEASFSTRKADPPPT